MAKVKIFNKCWFTFPTCYIWAQGELGLQDGLTASISNEITGPFLGSVVKVPFSHTREGGNTAISVLTSLKFPFLEQQVSQWALLSWPAEEMHVSGSLKMTEHWPIELSVWSEGCNEYVQIHFIIFCCFSQIFTAIANTESQYCCQARACRRASDLKRLYALDNFSAISSWGKAINPLHMFHLRPKKTK